MSQSIDRFLSLDVGDIMSEDVISVRADDTMETAAEVLSANKISGVPVVDAWDHCVGVISAADFKRPRIEIDREGVPLSDHLVADHMTSPAVTVTPESSLMDAGFLMCRRHIHRLPVVDDAALLVGMVSSLDIVASMVHRVSMEAVGEDTCVPTLLPST